MINSRIIQRIEAIEAWIKEHDKREHIHTLKDCGFTQEQYDHRNDIPFKPNHIIIKGKNSLIVTDEIIPKHLGTGIALRKVEKK